MSGILVTGVSGFVGQHLTRELAGRGHRVVGVGLHEQANPVIAGFLGGYTACDLTDPEQVRKIPLDGIDGVISLAGLAQVGTSFKDPERYHKINVAVLSVLAQRILDEKRFIRILAISSGAVYDSSQALPLNETSRLTNSSSPYAQSKILMEREAERLRGLGLACVVARPFNHIGPGQEPGFLVPDLADKIRAALKTGVPVIVGNLRTKRDYTDVRDVVRAYADLIIQSELKHDLYNVCSGRSLVGEQILNLLSEAMGAAGKLDVRTDESLIRPDDPPDLYGRYKRLSADTGWKPVIKIEQTIKDYVQSVKSN